MDPSSLAADPLNRHAERGENERGHDQTDVETGQNAKGAGGEVVTQARVGEPTPGDQEAGDRENPSTPTEKKSCRVDLGACVR